MRIQHNIMAMSAYRNYTNNVAAMKKNLEKLSSGYKINRAGDDAAGLAISEKMRAQITGLETAQKNAKDGISLVQTAEGALTEVHDMLNRMVELATQSANGTYDNTTDRNQMQKEIDQLRDEINRIADSSNFNGINLLDGSMSTATSKVGNVTLVNSGTAPTITMTPATSVVAWGSKTTTNATFSQVPSASLVHLHSEGEVGAVGSFTIDLGGLDVQSASGVKASVTIKIGGQSFKVTASATGAKITAKTIADKLAASAVVYATKNGTLTIGTKGATVAKGAILYTATASGNKVTFKAAYVAKTAATVGTVKASANKINSVSDIPRGFKAEHNYSVTASITGATAGKDGFVQVGVTEYTNTKAESAKQFAQAVLTLDVSKIKDQMKITVNGVERIVKLDKDSTGDIDLSKFMNAAGTAADPTKQKEIAQAIANAFKHDETDGIEIGVNASNNLVIAEKVTASRQSAVTDEDTRKKLETLDGFKSLIKFEEQTKNGETAGTAALTINTSKLKAGNTVTITLQDGTTKKYTVTKDKALANNAAYLYVNDDKTNPTTVADSLKAALERDIPATQGTVKMEGKNVILEFAVKGGAELKDVTAKAVMAGNKALRLQIGDTADSYNQLDVTINDCHTDSLGIADISIANQDDAALAVDAIKDAINYVSDVRGTLGATQNRLDHTINNLSVMTENIQDAESTIRDTDVADEMMAYTKNNILIQSAQAMLAQANQVPQGVLQLLQ